VREALTFSIRSLSLIRSSLDYTRQIRGVGRSGRKRPLRQNLPACRKTAVRAVEGLISTAEGVSDRGANSEHVVGVESVIDDGVVILDVVVVNLGADK